MKIQRLTAGTVHEICDSFHYMLVDSPNADTEKVVGMESILLYSEMRAIVVTWNMDWFKISFQKWCAMKFFDHLQRLKQLEPNFFQHMPEEIQAFMEDCAYSGDDNKKVAEYDYIMRLFLKSKAKIAELFQHEERESIEIGQLNFDRLEGELIKLFEESDLKCFNFFNECHLFVDDVHSWASSNDIFRDHIAIHLLKFLRKRLRDHDSNTVWVTYDFMQTCLDIDYRNLVLEKFIVDMRDIFPHKNRLKS